MEKISTGNGCCKIVFNDAELKEQADRKTAVNNLIAEIKRLIGEGVLRKDMEPKLIEWNSQQEYKLPDYSIRVNFASMSPDWWKKDIPKEIPVPVKESPPIEKPVEITVPSESPVGDLINTLISDCKMLRAEKKSYRQIGDILGISHMSVKRYLKL
jgi:hypothetical protein